MLSDAGLGTGGATPEEVKRSYRELVKIWHPDRFGDDARLRLRAQEKLKEINLAYERLYQEPASGTEPEVTAREASPPQSNRGHSPDALFVNSLGMKFVRVPGTDVLFSIWPTRVRDYAAIHKDMAAIDGSWKEPGFQQTDVHPVVNVSWNDAKQFARWLSEKERREGRLTAQQSYRLPTDTEWSWAVGIGEEEEKRAGKFGGLVAWIVNTPANKSMEIKAGEHPWAYPWGRDWPPPRGAGNYNLNTDN